MRPPLSQALIRSFVQQAADVFCIGYDDVVASRKPLHVQARRLVWRRLVREGFLNTEIAKAWGCSPGIVSKAVAGMFARPSAVADDYQALTEAAEEAAARLGYDLEGLIADDRHKAISRARQAVYAECSAAGFSSVGIGKVMHRDHSSVLHGIEAHKARKASGYTGLSQLNNGEISQGLAA